jgi:hypothetical protein
MTDQELTQWLKENNWKRTESNKVNCINYFFDNKNKLICNVLYNNQTLERRIFIND